MQLYICLIDSCHFEHSIVSEEFDLLPWTAANLHLLARSVRPSGGKRATDKF